MYTNFLHATVEVVITYTYYVQPLCVMSGPYRHIRIHISKDRYIHSHQLSIAGALHGRERSYSPQIRNTSQQELKLSISC